MNYTTSNAKGWRDSADRLFMSQFQGAPCAICGERAVRWGNRMVTTMGHHLLTKAHHKAHRYNPVNIIVLCADHHMGQQCSPHADDSAGVHEFYSILARDYNYLSDFMEQHRYDRPEKSFSYRDVFLMLGGTVDRDQKKKDWKPTNLAADVRSAKAADWLIGYTANS